MKTTRRFLTAAISIAIASIFFACSSDGGGGSSDPGVSSSEEPSSSSGGSSSSSSGGGSSSSSEVASSSSGIPSSSSEAVSVPKCNGTEYDPATQECYANAVYPKCGSSLAEDKACFTKGAVSIAVPKCAGNPQSYDPSEYECKSGKNGVYLKGAVNAVLIGTQTWMADNLNIPYNDGTDSWCDESDASYCATYGRLYNWAAANIVCPSGWKLPSNDDWDALYLYVDADYEKDNGYSETAGLYLKASSGWGYYGNGEDIYGFSALPGGHYNGRFSDVGGYGFWWSSTEYEFNGSDAYGRRMKSEDNANWFGIDKPRGLSVRCVKG